jgi:alanine racemase
LVAPARLCGVVKSNAYGHALVPVAKALADAGIVGLSLAVFSPQEALVLREAGLRCRLLVAGPASDDVLGQMAERDVECAVLCEDDIDRFAEHGLAVHIKVETGIARFGIPPPALARAVERGRTRGVRVTGIYSHLANAEDLDERLTMLQLHTLLEAASLYPNSQVDRHIAASAAAMLWPQTRLDMVRCGIALYGRWTSDGVRAAAGNSVTLTPALRWFAPIVQLRDVEAGQSVGYGCDFVPDRQTRIAVLPLGYADGLPRAVGGGNLRVRIGKEPAPIVGRVCMNACMLDVTDVRPHPVRGDIAEIDIEHAALATGTINYEILARLSPALERRIS